MNYTTRKVLENILLKEYRRKEAVFLAGRIKKANQSPGFIWEKSIKQFSRKFSKEAKNALETGGEYAPEKIDWIELIIHFGNQSY